MISYRQADLVDKLRPKPHTKGEKVKLSDLVKGFDEGKAVVYIPGHAHGDPYHKDCEIGKITSWNDSNVFVDFSKGDTHPACNPSDLVWMFNYNVKSNSGYEHVLGTLEERLFADGNPRWAAIPDGYNNAFFLSNPENVPSHRMREGNKIPIGFDPQDQWCRYEP